MANSTSAKKVSGPSRGSKENMHDSNPKAPKGKLKDKVKEATNKSSSIIQRGWQSFVGLLKDGKDLIVNGGKRALTFLKGLADKEKIHQYAGNIRAVLAGIMILCSGYIAITTLLSYFTVAQVGVACGLGVVATYAIYRITMNPTTRDAVKPSVKEMLSPVAA